MNKNIKRIPTYLILAVVAVFLIVWIGALVKCEVLTNRYYSDFKDAYKDNTWITEIEYFKVFKCDGETAEVYYVSSGKSEGWVHSYEKQNGAWKQTGVYTVWSVSGSASGVIWPYWWQFVYTGF